MLLISPMGAFSFFCDAFSLSFMPLTSSYVLSNAVADSAKMKKMFCLLPNARARIPYNAKSPQIQSHRDGEYIR